jgi:hypothetical protein
MAFDTDEATGYQIRSPHRHEEVPEGIPPDYTGIMVTDRGRSDDAQAFDDVTPHKGLAHILRSSSDVLRPKKGRARDCGERLKRLLQEARQRWRAYHAGEGAAFATQVQGLRETITSHLRPRILMDPDKQRLLNGIGGHHDRGPLLRFLEAPRIEPTNKRAERVRRPAVIARKGSQCSQNAPGAYAFAAVTSVIRTQAKRGVASMVEGLYHLFRSARVHTAPP